MKPFFLFFFIAVFLLGIPGKTQPTYLDTIKEYQSTYIKNHEVVKGNERNYLHFFPVDDRYRVMASFEEIVGAPWFKMETSGKEKKIYRVYGRLHFKLKDTSLVLEVYQSQQLMRTKEYADYLFIPFTDNTNGEESYENGRYIELTTGDIKDDVFLLDFNKAYNPYCAYVSNLYNCPIPPKANFLPVSIPAGEMKFGKAH
jgi:uncharacterized protein (DUF1684 family)